VDCRQGLRREDISDSYFIVEYGALRLLVLRRQCGPGRRMRFCRVRICRYGIGPHVQGLLRLNAGRRTDLITFQGRVLTNLPNGGIQTTWSPLAVDGGFTEWAEPLRQSETVVQFTIPYRSGITPASHRIIWEDAIWNIASAIRDPKNIDLRISCDFSMMVEVTTIQSTEREFIDGIPIVARPE